MVTLDTAAQADAVFQQALALHRQLRRNEARVLCETVLRLQSRHSRALHLLGVIDLQDNQPQRALELIGNAILIDPQNAFARFNHGNALCALNRYEAATASYDQAIALKADWADVYYNRGNALQELGQYAAAVASYDQALAIAPTYAQVYSNRGIALSCLQQYEAAVASYDQAVAIAPTYAEAHSNRGIALFELRQYEAAVASYDRAIALRPDYADAFNNRGNALRDHKELDAALASYNQAIAIKPDCAEAYSNRGIVLKELGQLDAALGSYNQALAIKTDYAEAFCNRGLLLHELTRLDAARANYCRAIEIRPGFAEAYFNRSLTSLLAGDLESGWTDYEWRWRLNSGSSLADRRDFPQSRWSGQECIEGSTILLHSEQGLGDTLQFCRYAKLVADLGARVILEVQRPLQHLLSGLDGVAQLVVRGEALPAFDYHCPLMSLPLALKTTLSTVPAQMPYLKGDPQKVSYWKDRLGEKKKRRVGLVWSGGFRPNQPELWSVNSRRNIPLAKLAALKHPDLEFLTLQKGQPGESELADLISKSWDGPELADFTSLLNDFSDTAALMTQLDLLISVDTSAAHLAGALGKPVWILNRFDSCWRWLLERTDSPWYPTVKLYRQERAGDWDGVVERVRADLAQFATELNSP